MAKKKALPAPLLGVFKPAPPKDSAGVLRLFAIACRIAAERPDLFPEIDGRLSGAMRELQPPPSLCAADCARMWKLFSRVAQSPKVSLRVESAKALYRDFDTIGQRLDLAPLPRWQDLPLSLDEDAAAGPRKLEAMSSDTGGDSLDTVRGRAKGKRTRGELTASDVLKLLRTLSSTDRDKLLRELVTTSTLVRSDAMLLSRLLHDGGEVGPEDEALSETLVQVGGYLAR